MLALLVVLPAALLVLRLLGVSGGRYVTAALALVPYVSGCGFVLACTCLALRRMRLAAVTMVLAVALAATLLPRILPNSQPDAAGPTVGVMALNLRFGGADASAVVDLVRSHDVDVLCLLELTPRAVSQLRESGLFENATLDHAPLRELLDSGYVDAAAQRGAGLHPTWPEDVFPPPVTIDHILVDRHTAVRDYAALDVSGSDHDAVFAEVTLPG